MARLHQIAQRAGRNALRISLHCAPICFTPALCDLTGSGRFRPVPSHSIAVEQPESVVQQRTIPNLPQKPFRFRACARWRLTFFPSQSCAEARRRRGMTPRWRDTGPSRVEIRSCAHLPLERLDARRADSGRRDICACIGKVMGVDDPGVRAQGRDRIGRRFMLQGIPPAHD